MATGLKELGLELYTARANILVPSLCCWGICCLGPLLRKRTRASFSGVLAMMAAMRPAASMYGRCWLCEFLHGLGCPACITLQAPSEAFQDCFPVPLSSARERRGKPWRLGLLATRFSPVARGFTPSPLCPPSHGILDSAWVKGR